MLLQKNKAAAREARMAASQKGAVLLEAADRWGQPCRLVLAHHSRIVSRSLMQNRNKYTDKAVQETKPINMSGKRPGLLGNIMN